VNELTSNLDDVVLSRPRLSILAALISGNALDFTYGILRTDRGR
jgi:hypothetical protein